MFDNEGCLVRECLRFYAVAFKDGSSQKDNQMKHSPLPEQLKDMNKMK